MLSLVLVLAAHSPPPLPPPPPLPASSMLWDRELASGLRIEMVRELTWPGLYLPAFTLAHGQRVVHRLTFSFARAPLRAFSFDVVAVGRTGDPRAAMTSARPSGEGFPVLALRANVELPRTSWKLSALQAFTGYASSAPTALVGRTPRAIGSPTVLLWRRF